MKIAILGYDVEGRASYDYFAAQGGHELTIHDRNPDTKIPEGATSVLGANYLDDLDRYDLLMRTAGLPPHIILEKNPDVASKITSHINEFLKVCPTNNVIGVTGTKGKGTTSTLITKMLEAGGKEVWLGGNIGLPPLTFLNKLSVDSWVVLELSSFQLSDLTQSPLIGVCLMVVPEHLDWHPNLAGYIHSKSNLFEHQTAGDTAIYFAENETSKQIASHGQGQKIPYYAPPGASVKDNAVIIDDKEICKTTELKLLGRHNWQNVCAAVTAVWQITQDVQALRSILTAFAGLEHRIELVRELNGVSYYDDSYGTAPETSIVAIKAFKQPKVIILGGADKGASYDELARTLASDNIRKALLIGDQAPRIQAALEAAGFSDFIPGGNDMSEIVANSQKTAQPGDVVLLSPACTSFDMFKNYKQRGEEFKRAVQALV